MDGSGGVLDPRIVRKERESFVALQHLYNLGGAGAGEASLCSRIERDLGFERGACTELVEHLVHVGYVATSGLGEHLSITPAGIAYIEQLARRRRSVRAPHPQD